MSHSIRISRSKLALKAFAWFIAAFAVLGAVLFLTAGTMNYPEAWTYIALLFGPAVFITVYLLIRDPEMLEHRMILQEKDTRQDLIMKAGTLFYLLLFIIPGLDRRFQLSHVPSAAVITSDLLVLTGYFIAILAMIVNRFASRIIEIQEGHKVIQSGPYAIVRHPMYLGVLIMFTFTPTALGSWWALACTPPLFAVIIARLLMEEKMLLLDLAGYADYASRTKYRLIPWIW